MEQYTLKLTDDQIRLIKSSLITMINIHIENSKIPDIICDDNMRIRDLSLAYNILDSINNEMDVDNLPF